MGKLKVLEDPDKLHILLEYVDDSFLDGLIKGENCPEKLSCYLKWKYDRINKNISKRQDLSVNNILNSKESLPSVKKSVLKWGLLIQKSNQEFIDCIKWFNEKLSNLRCKEKNLGVHMEELFVIAEVILIIKKEREQEISVHMDIENLEKFLFELTNIQLNSEYYLNVSSVFLSYFDEIYARDPKKINNVVFYLIEQENFDFLSIMFNKKLHQLAESACFHESCLWNLLKNHITIEDSIIKKQSLHIMSLTIEYFKDNNSAKIPEVLRTKSLDDWNLYFILVHLSREKQLHLVKPTLKLLQSIVNLHISWQSCLYKILLNHSQLFVIYKTVEHLMNLRVEDDDSFRDILRFIINALNKYEYSDLSRSAYNKFDTFCNYLDGKYYTILFEEFISIEWNPAAAWCSLNSISPLLCNLPQKLIINMLHSCKSLPHTFIRNNCIYLFLQRFIEKREINVLEDLLLIGKFLLFTDSEIDKELFRKVIEVNEIIHEEDGSELLVKVIQSIEEKNEKNLHVCLEIMDILQMSYQTNSNIPCSTIGDIIFLHCPHLNTLNILDYLLLRMDRADDNEFNYLLKYLDKLYPDQRKTNKINTYTKEYKEKLNTLWNLSKHNKSRALIAIKLIAESDYFESFMELLKLEKQSDIFENLRTHLYKLWINREFKYFPNPDQNENFTMLTEKLQILLELEEEQSLYLVVESLELLLNCCTSNEKIVESLNIYEECLKNICQLPSAALRSYSIVFFRSVFHLKLFCSADFIKCWKKWETEYFEDHFFESEIVMRVILQGCRKMILLYAPNVDILIPLIMRGLLCGTIVQKNQRVEYGICQEIHKVNKKFLATQNPNIISMELKMLSMESLYLLTKNNNFSTAGMLVKMLLYLYKKNYKTRYFPDSKIHFEKLRIVQALLLVVPCSTESQDQLVDFVLNSFCEESHQPCVKRLLQWLLIILMLSNTHKYLEPVIEKINTSNLLHPSSLVALIPVLYHVIIFLEPVKFWYQVTDAFLPWTMGANFKLRLYSQITLKMLLEKAIEKKLTKYVEKYSFLENSLATVLESSGNAVEQTLKNDLTFIESFNPTLHYSIENIFINLPRMLDVSSSEWENISEYKFSQQMDIKIKNDQHFPNTTKIDNKITEDIVNISEYINLQKKITPWKCLLEENTDNKTLGNIICVASLLEKAANLGGLSRTCEIFSVKQLVLHNWKIKDDKEFKNLSMSSENWVNVIEVKRENLSEFLMELKQQGYSLIGLEQTSESAKLNEFKFQEKTVLFLGNEKEGIPAPLLPLMDSCVEIPQFGQTRSLNVHVAGAICIWEYVRQHMFKN